MTAAPRGKGPRLPTALLDTLGGAPSASRSRGQESGRGRQHSAPRHTAAVHRRPLSRKELRKAQRQEKKGAHQLGAYRQHSAQQVPFAPARAQNRRPQQPEAARGKRPAEVDRDSGAAAKRTRFHELLPQATGALVAGGVNSAAAYLADLRAGREAEKRLGIKKGGTLKGPEDGLGSLLDGLTSATGQMVPGYLDPSAAAQARSLLGGKGGVGSGRLYDASSEGEGSEGEQESDDFAMMDDSDSSQGDSEEGGEGESEGDLSDSSQGDDEGEGDSDVLQSSDADTEGEAEEGSTGDDRTDEHSSDAEGTSVSDGEGTDEEPFSQPESPGQAAGQAAAPSAAARYVPPALRQKSSEQSNIQRHVTGLLNRLAEANLVGIAKELSALYKESRRQVVQAVIASLVQAAVRGPRASSAFAVTAAALVAGVAGMSQAPELSAGFVEAAAQELEAAGHSNDSLATQNLAQLIASCHATGMLSTELVYGLLHHLVERFTEDDIALVVALLNARGLALRSADPAAMKAFVLSVTQRVASVSESQGKTDNKGLSTRARLMLDLVIDIKNNRTTAAAGGATAGRSKKGGSSHTGGGGASIALSSATAAWLKGCNVDQVALRGITWSKVLKPDKKGMWWLPEAGDRLDTGPSEHKPAAGHDDGTRGAGGGLGDASAASEAAALLKLAVAQRMNTDTRRAIFFAVMGATDVVHAHERVLKLPLKGDQEREIVRVVMDCCVHETAYNPFYALLLVRLATHSRSHRVTLQYALWDQCKVFKDFSSVQLSHLARLNATLVAKGVVSLTSLKGAQWGPSLPASAVFYWRVFFQHVLAACQTQDTVSTVFGALASHKDKSGSKGDGGGASLRTSVLLFLQSQFGPWLANQDVTARVGKASMDDLLIRLQQAQGVLQRGH